MFTLQPPWPCVSLETIKFCFSSSSWSIYFGIEVFSFILKGWSDKAGVCHQTAAAAVDLSALMAWCTSSVLSNFFLVLFSLFLSFSCCLKCCKRFSALPGKPFPYLFALSVLLKTDGKQTLYTRTLLDWQIVVLCALYSLAKKAFSLKSRQKKSIL